MRGVSDQGSEAVVAEAITAFRGKYRFLSNFYPATVTLAHEDYPSVEHAYQAAKTLDPTERRRVRLAVTAGEAKQIGQQVPLRAGWDKVKVGIMRELLYQKFNEPTLARLLKETAPRELVEGNDWHDTFWGVCRGVGGNMLGKLLMEVRDTL